MMTMPLAAQRVLSVMSVKNGPMINIPASSLSSPQFASFSGLSMEKRFSDLCIAEPSREFLMTVWMLDSLITAWAVQAISHFNTFIAMQ